MGIDMTKLAICIQCQSPIKTFTQGNLCEGCKSNDWVPGWFSAKREHYQNGEDGEPARADWRVCPPTGVPMLDNSEKTVKLSSLNLTHSSIKSLQAVEQEEGLNNLEYLGCFFGF